MIYQEYLAHAPNAMLFMLLTISNCLQAEPMEHNDLGAYPKASEDATEVYRLQSNLERTHFIIDGKEMGVGRKLIVRINKQGHTIVARPENCARSKEEYVQFPYSPEVPLSFTFVTGECDDPALVAGPEEPEPTGNPPIRIKDNTGTINIITGGNKGTANQTGHSTQHVSGQSTGTSDQETVSKNSDALHEIQEFVGSICQSTTDSGASENIDISVSSKLSGLLNKLANIGIEGAAEYQKSEYIGVLQKDLAAVLSKDSDCKKDLSKMLIEKLIN